MNRHLKTFKDKFYYDKQDSARIFLYAVIVPFLISLFLLAITMIVCGAMHIKLEDISNNVGYIIPASLCAPIGFSIIYFIYNRKYKISHNALNFSFKVNVKNIFLVILIALISFAGFYYFSGLFEAFLNFIGYKVSLIALPNDNFGWFILNILLLAVLPAITEELVFRGMIFNGLKTNLKFIPAMLISSLCFSLVHMNVQQLLYPFILGMLLAFIMYKTSNLIYCMIIHFVNNFVVILISYIYNSIKEPIAVPANLGIFSFFFSLSLIALAFISILTISKFLKKQDTFRVKLINKENFNIYGYVAFAVCVVAIIVDFFVNIFA